MRTPLALSLLLLTVQFSFGQQFTNLHGDYLGQTPPGDTPMVFARGVISTELQNHSVPSFSPDGNQVLWQANQRPRNDSDAWVSSSMTMKRIDNRWTSPEKSPYGDMPFFSPDGKRIYFVDKDLAVVEKQGATWSAPKSLEIVARSPELQFVAMASIANNGTLYFIGNAPGLGEWKFGIYRAELVHGEYAKPEMLPPSINAPGGVRNWAPSIAPDESYLIFCSTRGLPAEDEGDLFISFRQPGGRWTEPRNMGAPINTGRMERFSALSPDGKYLFFTRDTPDFDEDVYWVSAKVIEDIRKEALGAKDPQ